VTPGYFEAMGIPVVEGRTLNPDDSNRRLASLIISRSVKAQYWPNTSALGKRITLGGGSPARVVGVVGDVHGTRLDEAPDKFIYVPMLDADGGGTQGMTLTLRTAIDPLDAVPDIRRAIAELDPDLPMSNVRSMQRVLDDSLSHTSFTMSLLVIAALVALSLGSVGIYGVLSYIVSQRGTEISIRSALGAAPGELLRMVLAQAMRLAGLGVLLGLLAVLALGSIIAALLYGISPVDPVTLAAAAVIFAAAAMLASLLPRSGRQALRRPMRCARADGSRRIA
jgi:predicted lysophospholipase L1 biosynthesis ABC-type transport system permease subunit